MCRGFTAAGTAPDFHRIPFLTTAVGHSYTNISQAKIGKFFGLKQVSRTILYAMLDKMTELGF